MANYYKSINLNAAGGSDDRRVKVSTDDANPDFLEGKVESGDSIVQISVTSPGADETLVVSVDETAINHDNLSNYEADEHAPLDDASTTVSNLWSASKIQALLDAQDDAAEITYTPLEATDWDVTPTDVAEGLDELSQRINDDEDALAAHIADTTDAHDASAISNVAAGNISATNVQDALNELDSEKYVAADFDGDFDTRLDTKDTDDLSEGVTNLYFTEARAKTAAVVDSTAGSETDQAPSVSSMKAYVNKNPYSIEETSFTFANNVSTPTDITGLSFSTANVRGFTLTLLVERGGDGLFEEFEVRGILNNPEFDISIESIGDDSGVNISVDSSGQFQYTSSNLTSGGDMIFKATAFSRVS